MVGFFPSLTARQVRRRRANETEEDWNQYFKGSSQWNFFHCRLFATEILAILINSHGLIKSHYMLGTTLLLVVKLRTKNLIVGSISR